MGEAEFIDLLEGSSHKKSDDFYNKSDFRFNEEESYSPQRSRINDYKHSSSTINKGQGVEFPYSEQPVRAEKSYLNISDERIVWAGAIFVFFGVLLFLVGFWIGKTNLKENLSNKITLEKQEEKLDQRKVENLLSVAPSPLDESVKAQTPPVVSQNEKAETTVTPEANLSIPAVRETKSEPRNVKLHAAAKNSVLSKPVLKAVKSEKLPALKEKNFTIQVSAHTSMEKARGIENNLRKMGFQSYLVEATVNGTTYYRVRIGKFGVKDEALTALNKIKSSSVGKDSFILNLN
jgi:cell division septation protein DedD